MFARKLRKLREDAGKDRKEVAKALGLSLSAISNYENGIRKPESDETWIKIANYFNVSIDYLMDIEKKILYTPTTKEQKLKDLIEETKLPDEKLDILIEMIESWK